MAAQIRCRHTVTNEITWLDPQALADVYASLGWVADPGLPDPPTALIIPTWIAPWSSAVDYPKNAYVSYSGSTWLATGTILAGNAPPGSNPAWVAQATGGGSGGLPSGGSVGQVVANTSPGTGTWHSLVAGDVGAVAKAGDTMSGPLVLPSDPTTALQAATKQYVDAHAGGGGSLPSGGLSLQALSKKSTTTGDADWLTVDSLVGQLTTDQATYDPLDVEWFHGTISAAEHDTITLDVDASLWTNGTGLAGVEILYSQTVLSGNLFSGVVNGVVSGAHRTRCFGAVPGNGVPGGSGATPAVGTVGFGNVRMKAVLTGLTVGQPIYYQVIPFLIDSGSPILQLPSAGTFVCVSPSGARAYILSGASVIPVELGRSPENWVDALFPAVTAAFPVRAFVTSDGQKLWTTGLSVGAIQVFDTDSFQITSSPTVSGMAPYGMCQDPTGTRTIDIATYGGAYTTVGSPTISTFAAAFTPAAVGKTLSGALAAAFPANTKVLAYVDSQHITMSANATVAVTFGNIGTYSPAVLDGIAYVCDQGSGHNTIQLFDVALGTAGAAYSLTSPYVPYTIAVSPDGSKLAVYCKNSMSNYRLVILNAQTGAILFDLDVGTNSGVLPDPVWEPDSVHGWLACSGSNKLRRFNASTGAFETAHDTSFSQPNALAITPTGRTLFVAGGNASASTWAYFMLNPLPTGALVQYDGNAAYGPLSHIALGPDCFIYAVGTNGFLDTVRGGTVGCYAASSPATNHLELRVAGAH